MLLHGFAGTGRSWDPVIAALGDTRYLAPDLHSLPQDLDTIVDAVLELAPPAFTLVGYSMGGRIAQHVALKAPGRVTRLVLVATSPGLDDEAERAARRASDEALAARAEAGTIEDFADLWSAQPLFAGTPPQAARIWREDILRNDPEALAASLRGLGTGVLPATWDRLEQLRMPVDVVVGADDAKFVALGEQLAAALPDARLHVVAQAGHGVPREQPELLARIIAG